VHTSETNVRVKTAVPWLRRLAADLLPRRPGFAPGPVYVEFMMDKVALGQVFCEFLWFFSCQYQSTVALHIHILSGRIEYVPIGVLSSETRSHPINMNNDNKEG
jgi:hypothetical protein